MLRYPFSMFLAVVKSDELLFAKILKSATYFFHFQTVDCKDTGSQSFCMKQKEKGKCSKNDIAEQCQKTCDLCPITTTSTTNVSTEILYFTWFQIERISLYHNF